MTSECQAAFNKWFDHDNVTVALDDIYAAGWDAALQSKLYPTALAAMQGLMSNAAWLCTIEEIARSRCLTDTETVNLIEGMTVNTAIRHAKALLKALSNA